MPSDPYVPPAGPPERPGLHAVARARWTRLRGRWAILGTSAVAAACVVALVVAVVPRQTPPEQAPASASARPSATAVDPATLPSQITVTLRDGAVLLDGFEVGRTDRIEASGTLQPMTGLYIAMSKRRLEYAELSPTVIIEKPADTPDLVTRSVFMSIELAGYAEVHFATPKSEDAGAP